ncbi:MAG TPA: ABC transporter [Peptococcaceae bacterium]|nr:MAG: 2-polyprenylphenol 6-hydroxylase [Clostridia bacterium 41_269]HBT20872.1 ABC transporter [Peptococcaceae bacterium]
MIKRRYKHIHRLRVIANTFAKHGFGYLLDVLGIRDVLPPFKRFQSDKSHRLSRGERVRLVFEELGTTFIKLGQVLSTRSDFLPRDIVKELEKLQDWASPVDFSFVEQIIKEELGGEISEIFSYFDTKPFASASIAQVHEAELLTGEKVVVKVQRPNLKEVVETDLEILFDLARIADRRTSWGEKYRFTDLVEEFSRSILAEMDFRIEGRNGERLKENFMGDARVYIPEVFWDYSTSKVLTLERISGIKLSHVDKLAAVGFDKAELAESFAQVMMKQILMDGFFHGDPHPGNVVVLENGALGFMDFGIVGCLSPDKKNQLAQIIIALASQNTDLLMHTIFEMGVIPSGVSRRELKADLDKLRDKYYDKPVEDIKIGDVFNDLFDISFKYDIRMPSDFAPLAKVVIITEGVVKQLAPELSIMKIVEPFARKLIKKQLSPFVLKKNLWGYMLNYIYLLPEIPKLLRGLKERLDEPEVRGVIRHEGFERLLMKMDQIVNRLSFSIVLLAFSIIMSGLVVAYALSTPKRTVFFDFPIFEVGFIAGGVLFFWLIISIIRSGRM